MTETSTHYVTEQFSGMLRRKYGDLRHASKRLARMAGCNEDSARNWIEGRNTPNLATTIRLMRADDDVFDLIFRLAERPANRDLSPEDRLAIEAAITIMQRKF